MDSINEKIQCAVKTGLDHFPQIKCLMESLDEAVTRGPHQATACEDLANISYIKACALLEFSGDAAVGLDADGSRRPEPIESWVMDIIRLEVEKVRLAGEILYDLHQQAQETK